MATRRGAQGGKKFGFDEKPTLQILKDMLLNVESMFTDGGLPLNREWETKEVRERLRAQIENAKSVSDF